MLFSHWRYPANAVAMTHTRLLPETKVDANNAQRSEEERILVEFRERVASAAHMLARAATRIQKVARGRAVRNTMKAAAKGKKGKGGKKKK